MLSSAHQIQALAFSSTTPSLVLVLTEETLAKAEHTIRFSQYSNVAIFVLLLYEWVSCFQDEIKLIYGRGWSHVSSAYMLCRYYPLLSWIVVAWAYNWDHSPAICRAVVKPVHGLSFPLQLFGQAVMIMRAYAFSGRSRVVLAILTIVYGALIGGATYLFLADIPVPDLDDSSAFEKSGCFPDFDARSFRFRAVPALMSGMVLDLLNLCVVCFYCLKRRRYGGSALVQYFYKQGLNVFLWMSAANVATLAVYFSLSWGIGVPFVLVISNILACRIILQLRSRAWQSDAQILREHSRIVREDLERDHPPDEWAINLDPNPPKTDIRRESEAV